MSFRPDLALLFASCAEAVEVTASKVSDLRSAAVTSASVSLAEYCVHKYGDDAGGVRDAGFAEQPPHPNLHLRIPRPELRLLLCSVLQRLIDGLRQVFVEGLDVGAQFLLKLLHRVLGSILQKLLQLRLADDD